MATTDGWQATIGLEVHVQLATESKLFCRCGTGFGVEPNTQVCPICLGHPGVLPTVNEKAIALATRLGLALGCSIQSRSIFARKNYLYADLPKGYQISQYEFPIAFGGQVALDQFEPTRFVALERIHIEEDAGKLVHDVGGYTGVDYNRAGIPLVEVVTQPILTSAEEAAGFMRALREIVRFLDVSDGNMEQGSLRADANISVRRVEEQTLGTKVEVKNLNSFKFTGDAIDYEIHRQIALAQAGQRVVQETRLWDERFGQTRLMRSKESASDYRYFPEPDLPPIVLSEAQIAHQQREIGDMPLDLRARWTGEWKVTPDDAGVLSTDPRLASFYGQAVVLAGTECAQLVANWLLSELTGLANDDRIAVWEGRVSAAQLALLVCRVAEGAITHAMGKKVLASLWREGGEVDQHIKEGGFAVLRDENTLINAAMAVLDAHPDAVARFRGGHQKALGFLVGKVMAATRGQADPKSAHLIVQRLLSEEGSNRDHEK